MDEEHPLNPRSPYAATKAGADRLAYSYFVTYGLPIVIVRPFNNYGPRQHPEKVVPRFITQALADEPLTIHGDGHASRDWLYVDDDAEAIEAAIEAPIEHARRRGGQRRDRRRHLRRRHRATRCSTRSASRASLCTHVAGAARARSTGTSARPRRRERLLGWRARTSFEDGLERTVAWYRDNEAWWRGDPRAGSPRLLVLGAGPAQLGLLEAARARGRLDRGRRPRPGGAGLPARRPALHRLDRGRAGDRAARRRRSRRRRDLARAPTGRSRSRRASPSGSGCRIRSRRRRRCSRRPSCASASGSPRPACRSRAGRSSATDEAPPASSGPVVVKAPDRQGQKGLSLVARRGRAAGEAIAAARAVVPQRARARRGARRRAGGDGDRLLGRRRVRAAHRHRPVDGADPPAFGVALAHVWPSSHAGAVRRTSPRRAVGALGIDERPDVHAAADRPGRAAR